MKKTLLIDSNFLAYRAKITTGNLEYGGVRTGVMFGFFNQLIKVMSKIDTYDLVFFWDSKESKRKELLPTYKEKRREDQSEEEKKEWEIAFRQFDLLRTKTLPRIGLYNNILQKGYESDDLIANYLYHKNASDEVVVVTGDDDLLQTLGYCDIYNPAKEKLITCKDFVDKWGIEPHKWAEVKKIAGCKSDNVPGVPGVGEKTAVKYLKGDLKKSTKTYKAIWKNKDLIEFNHALVVLPFDNTIIPQDKIKRSDFDMREFLRVCREYDMNSFRRDDRKKKIKKLFKGE